ncbi:MAG: TVP38/TMEM64 family protein [bacterium]|nr:TVP38/TMEM64 family protein [bacterium]
MLDRTEEGKRLRLSSPGGTALQIGAVLAVAFVSWRFIEATGAEAFLLRLGPRAPLVSIPIHVVLSATPFPSEMVGLANGAVYGLWLGAACSWLGWWCGAVLEFTLVRRGTRGIEASAGMGRFPRWLSRFPVGHPVFLIVGRQLPFGFHLVNVLAGVAEIGSTRFVVCAAISNLPYAWITAAMGAGLVASH